MNNRQKHPVRFPNVLKAIACLHFLSTFSIALVSQRSPLLNMRSLSQQGKHNRISTTTLSMGKYSAFTLMATERSEYLDIDVRNFSLLDFLPQRGLNLPFRTRKLIHAVTESYIFQKRENYLPLYTADDLQRTIDEEYDVKQVPLCVGNWTLKATDDDEDEHLQTVIEVFSLAAMYRLPKEITLVLLKPIASAESKLYINVFETLGWQSVSFPRGLALQLKRELRSETHKSVWWKDLLRPRQRAKKLQLEAAIAVSEAQRVTAPNARPPRPRDEVLAKIEQQLSQEETIPLKDELLFFPNSVPLKSFSLRRFRRFVKHQYSTLKRQGRAGVLSYCVFNLLFYTIGMAWQWQRVAPADPLTSSSSMVVILVRKFARVFASLYVAAQFIKIPKVFGAIALAPYAQRALDSVSHELNVSQNAALIVLISSMAISWATIILALVLKDYSKLRQLAYMDKTLIKLYGL